MHGTEKVFFEVFNVPISFRITKHHGFNFKVTEPERMFVTVLSKCLEWVKIIHFKRNISADEASLHASL